MIVVAGALGGRTIIQPKASSVRPMSQKVRAALFNIVGDVIGMNVLDAYAGSGAIGIEALSRGAEKVIGIERSRVATEVIKANIAALGLGTKYQLLPEPVEGFASKLNQEFDLIVADPPYDQIDWRVIDQLGSLLITGGTMVVSHAGRSQPVELKSVKLMDTRRYGDSALSFYKNA